MHLQYNPNPSSGLPSSQAAPLALAYLTTKTCKVTNSKPNNNSNNTNRIISSSHISNNNSCGSSVESSSTREDDDDDEERGLVVDDLDNEHEKVNEEDDDEDGSNDAYRHSNGNNKNNEASCQKVLPKHITCISAISRKSKNGSGIKTCVRKNDGNKKKSLPATNHININGGLKTNLKRKSNGIETAMKLKRVKEDDQHTGESLVISLSLFRW